MKKLVLIFSILLLLVSLSSAGFSDNYAYKKNITINQSQLIESLTDFPLLVNIYDADLKNYALANGNDILFALDDYIKLDYQIESFNQSYNSTHASLIAWVKVNITNATNNVIWIYFNNTNATNQESRNVWTDGYKGIYHLSESSGGILDAGIYSHNSTAIGGTPDYAQTGKIGKGLNFASASNEYINFGDVNDYDFTGEYSVSAWFKTTQNAQYAGICGKLTTSPAYGYALQVHLGSSQVWIGNGSYAAPPGNTVNDNSWHHFYLNRVGNNNSYYIDGVYQKSVIANGTLASTSGFYIGSWGDTTYDYTGLVDEVQLANKSRSLGFIMTSFRNQNNTSAFYSLGQLTSSSSNQYNDLVNFSSFVENPASSSYFNQSQSYSFNVTIEGSNGTSWLEFNSINYSAFNYSNIFYSLINSIGAGSYSYRWWTYSNETTNNLSSSSSRNYIINKIGSSISLTLNGSNANISINRGESVIVNCSVIIGGGVVELYKEGILLDSGESIISNQSFNNSGNYNITCIYPSTQNYSSSANSYFVNVAERDIDSPSLSFVSPTPVSGFMTDKNSMAFGFDVNENNLRSLIWNFDSINYSIYDNSLVLGSNFENNSEFNESSFRFYDYSIYGNNGSCINCPNLSYFNRFDRENQNDNNLLFLERFNSDLSNWTTSSYGGEISIVTKDFSKKLLLNDTASFSYIYAERIINESFSNYIIEYDILYNSGSVGVMELLDGNENLISSVDVGSTSNTLSFDTDTTNPTNTTFNAGVYKQIILKVNEVDKNIAAYLSENDATYGSLAFIASKNYSNSNIAKIRFRTGQTETGNVYLDEIKIYNPVTVVIGDSITDGKRLWSTHPAYPEGRLSSITNESSPPSYRIGNLICENCWVANRAFGGSTTTSVNNYVQTALLDHGFKQIYIAVGHNDIAASTAISTMQSNFNSIISKVLASGINESNIVIANVFPGSDLNTAGELQLKSDWNAWLLNRSLELGAIYVDLDSALKDPVSPNQIKSSYNGGDGVHLNSLGNEVIAQIVTNSIKEADNLHGFKSIVFDGIDDSIIFGNSSSLSLSRINIDVWVNFTNIQNSSIMSKNGAYSLKIIDGKVLGEIKIGGQSIITLTNQSYADGKWHNYDLSYNGSALSLYVDGTLKSINQTSGEIDYTINNLTLGSNGTSFFKGSIDELKIYNNSLTLDQINKTKEFELIKINSTYWKAYANQTGLQQKVYYYNAFAIDANSLSSEAGKRNLSIYYDVTLPAITIISPMNSTYDDSIFINYTATDTSGINSCWYNLDNGGNITLANCMTTSINGLSDGSHTLNIYANDSNGNTNRSNMTFSMDSSAPYYTIIQENYPAIYSQNNSYFNITWSDPDIQSVLFESNFSGVSMNYSMQSIGNGVYQFSYALPAGTFYWKSYANDSYGHFNSSSFREFTILKSNMGATLYLNSQNSNLTLNYGNITNASVISVDQSATLYRNGALVSNPDRVNLGAGYYNYTFVFNGNQNYSATTNILFLNITKVTPVLRLLLNGFDSDISSGEQVNIQINASLVSDYNQDIEIYEEGVLISTGNPISLVKNYSVTGEYLWNVSVIESENYTSSSKSHTISVLDSNYPSFSNLKFSPSSPTSYQSDREYEFNSTWTDNVAIEEAVFEFQGTNYSLLNNQINRNGDEYYITISNLPAGSYNYKWHGRDSSANNVSTPVQTYVIDKAIGALFLSVSPSNSVNYGTTTNVHCVANNPESSLALTRNSALVSIPDNGILNLGSYNYACTSSASQNYTSASATSTLTIIKANPDIKLYLNGFEDNLEVSAGATVRIDANLSLSDGSQPNISLLVNREQILNSTEGIIEYNYTVNSGINNISISYLGDENYNALTVTRFVTVSSQNNGGGSGGGGSGGGGSGGGGGSIISKPNKNKTISLEFESLGDIIISPGESKILELNVRNTGETFLNKCKLKSSAGYESWIKSETNKNINPGEITEYIFEMSIPLDANRTDEPKLILECVEKSFDVPIKTNILNSGMDIEIDNLELINQQELAINYTVIGNADFDESVIFKVYDFEDNLLSEKSEKIAIIQGKITHSSILDVSKAEKGLLKIEISKKSGAIIVDEFFVYDSKQPITGFAFLDKVGGNSFYVIFTILIFAVAAFLIVKRMHTVNNLSKWEKSHKPEKVTEKEKLKEVVHKKIVEVKKEHTTYKKEEKKVIQPKKVKWNQLFEEKNKAEIAKQTNTKLKDEIEKNNFKFETYGKPDDNSGWKTY